MGYSAKDVRLPWQNRFERPSIDDLRGHYNKQLCGYHDTAREFIKKFDNVTESIDWHGLPWRWSTRFDIPEVTVERGWVYLVPDPEGPKVSVPMTEDMVTRLPRTRLKKHIREGIEHAKKVGDVRWTEWTITSKSQLEDVLDVAKRCYGFITTPAE